MSCCAPGAESGLDPVQRLPGDDEIRLSSRPLGDGINQIDLSVPAVHCGACIATVERALAQVPGVEAARVNLSTKRVSIRWRDGAVPPIAQTLARLGYAPHLFDDSAPQEDRQLAELLWAVAVSGFAAGNIMLLSVSVWSGAEGATRDLFHWVSALIALPALVFAGRVYYRSAWSALRHGRMNMDVPIAIGVSLAYAMSLYETINHGPHAYFDAAVSLLFFLLIGRTLDHLMRDRARTAVLGLARLAPRGALVVSSDGSRDYRPLAELQPGMTLLVAAGERIPVDARVLKGMSDVDCSAVTGENDLVVTRPGSEVRAGMLNVTGPLTVEVLKPATDSFLAEMVRMMEMAEGGRARYRRIAERVSAYYAPVVHLTALVTFIAWVAIDGDWHRAMTIAIAVLIITCPCALGLAVPMVQVVAARRLFEAGIMVKDGSAMERLAEADAVVFDKTGTLTLGRPRLVNLSEIPADLLGVAAELAAHSRHPIAQSIAVHAAGLPRAPAFDRVEEHPGFGMEGHVAGHVWRLGRMEWAAPGAASAEDAGTVLSRDLAPVASFRFQDVIRQDARAAVTALEHDMGRAEMLSGDSRAACATVAQALGMTTFSSGLLPAEKVARIAALTADGRKVLMVGDGLNDAPALSAAHVSMAPATAADIGRNAADFVFLRESLAAVPLARDVSLRAGRLIRQNIGLAIVYNAIAVPIAILGHVTPLIAAIAMSASSLLVIANALRLGGGGFARPRGRQLASPASAGQTA
jgi:Cu2+-exporting ATPase